jgi:micrococcal nuclease
MRKTEISFLILLIFFFSAFATAKEREQRKVTKVIDGITLELEGGETIRLIGVATPQPDPNNPNKQKWAEQAAEFTRKLVEGRNVSLEYAKEKADEQGHIWAYVYFIIPLKELSGIVDQSFMPFWGTGGQFMLNRMLIEYGYATTRSPFSFKYRTTFTQLEKNARVKQIGMWQDFH